MVARLRRMPGFLAAAILAVFSAVPRVEAQTPLPRIESRDGRHLLTVDGRPFLMLGAQANNSSNYPAALPKVWPMMSRLHANTLEIPVAWEQVEPEEGRFDFSYLDALLKGARERNLRVVLLWFGTWKNTNPSYAPMWVKVDNKRFPRMRTRAGQAHYVLSPHHRSTLEADKRAFVAVMRHLKEHDPRHTVIMVQPENEVGTYGIPRDFGPEAERLFRRPVPAELARKAGRSGSWTEVFGKLADTAFTAWHMARYIDEIAAAGRAVKDLPMYCNAALGDPFAAPGEGLGASGGPDMQVIDVWKAAAPHIDFVAPDIYLRDPKQVMEVLRLYARPDNALMVPEIGNAAEYARYFWPALGRGAIGFAPFGFDETGYSNYPLGAKALDEETVAAFASKYALFAPMAGAWARVAAENPTWGTARGEDGAEQSQVMGRWRVTAQYGLWQFGERDWTWIKTDPAPGKDKPVGGMVVAQTGPDEFLLSGSDVRARFGLAAPRSGEGVVMRVEEGRLDPQGRWVIERVWNGDQTDYGLNFTGRPVLLRVRLATYL